jgi:hypothetical protein
MAERKFKVGERVYFLKDGRSIKTNKTELNFCFVSNGVIVDSNDNGYTIKREGLELQTPPSDRVFATYEGAESKAKELNNKNLSELEEIVGWVKGGYYPL